MLAGWGAVFFPRQLLPCPPVVLRLFRGRLLAEPAVGDPWRFSISWVLPPERRVVGMAGSGWVYERRRQQ